MKIEQKGEEDKQGADSAGANQITGTSEFMSAFKMKISLWTRNLYSVRQLHKLRLFFFTPIIRIVIYSNVTYGADNPPLINRGLGRPRDVHRPKTFVHE